MDRSTYNPALYRISLLTTAAIFPLIFIGGLVTSHQAGLAVPDWPNSFGYNMFLFPPRYWVGGILYEHTHRLGASGVGCLSIILCIWAWKTEPRPLQRWLATSVLGAVIFQGILGGLRVVFVNLDLAMVHACVAQAVFCLAAFTTLAASRWWAAADDLSESAEALPGRRLVQAGVLTVCVVFCQLVLGVVMRHQGAGLAVPDIPLVYHHFLPPTSLDQLQQINADRVWNMGLPQVTLPQIWIHYAHRVWALVVTFSILMLTLHVFLFHRRRRLLTNLSMILLILLTLQLVLGLATVYYKKPADVASAHVAVGALVLMTSFVLTSAAFRLYWPKHVAAEARMEAPALRAV